MALFGRENLRDQQKVEAYRQWFLRQHPFALVAVPFTVWLFPSRTSTGRPTPVPHHEPIRGFGLSSPPPSPPDAPPPGTPKEFLGMPQIPPPKPRAKSAVDPDKIARLKQK